MMVYKILLFQYFMMDYSNSENARTRERENGDEGPAGAKQSEGERMFFRVITLLVTLLVLSAAQAQEISMVPVMVDGQTVHLAMRIYQPSTDSKGFCRKVAFSRVGESVTH
jgi:hypothetical protein